MQPANRLPRRSSPSSVIPAKAGTQSSRPPKGGRLKRVPISRILRNEEFGYTTITMERPLLDEKGQPILGTEGKLQGKPQADSTLRDTENIPLTEDITAYFQREVLPHAADARSPSRPVAYNRL